MPKKPKKELVLGRHFRWMLGRRARGVWYADGRSNPIDVGRHSLGTRDRDEALQALKRLDLERAVRFGVAPASILAASNEALLSLERGAQLYLDHARRPKVAGGVSDTSYKRYRAPLEKFVPFCRDLNIHFWNAVTRPTLEGYAAWLDDEGYEFSTEYFELTQIKTAMKWLEREKYLPASCLFHFPLRKPQGTTTYCYRQVEVAAILEVCSKQTDLLWLGDVILTLIYTGLRIQELSDLRWSDFDFESKITMLRLPDTSRQGTKDERRQARTTKSGRDRALPIHDKVLARLQQMSHHPDGLVFHGPLGGLLKPDTVRNVLVREVLMPLSKRFPSRAGEQGIADGRLHSFRHYFCSWCANQGVTEQTLMRWLGHVDSKMVKRYFHLHDEVSQQEMRKLIRPDSGAVTEAV
ncbi:MAG: tyrosine-type recombinase/integrase [Gemmataceae bacterium]